MELVALALAPIVFIVVLIYLKDEYDREPILHLLVAFVLGMATAAPVVIISQFLYDLTGLTSNSSPLELIIYAFVVVALLEEGMKFLVLRTYAYTRKEFDEPYDGIVYGVVISMGFAAVENVLYVVAEGYEVGLLRMFTAVPAHAVFGVLMGYFVGKAKFWERERRFWLHVQGLGAAVLAHGIYDYFLFADLGTPYFVFISFGVVIYGVYLSWKAGKLHKKISPHRRKE